jgi:superfamily I DNA/RNA helicase
MKITLPLINPVFDDNRITDELEKAFQKDCQVYIYKDEKNWISEEDQRLYGLWIEYGEKKNKTMMFDIDLDDLEMFANSLLKSIEMFRRDYAEVLKDKIMNGSAL